MPYLPSIGDIINLAFLVKDLIEALEESRGSSIEYQDCISHLRALEEVVHQVEGICAVDDIIIASRREALLNVAHQCQAWIAGVLDDVQKYDSSLRKGGSRNRIRDGLRKIQWRALRSDELAKITLRVTHYSSIFSFHVSTANLFLLQSKEQIIKEMLFSVKEHRHLLNDIRHQSYENNRLVRSTNSSLSAKLLESLEWVQNLSLEFTKVSQTLFIMPWLAFRLFSSSQNLLPSHLERCLYPEPLTLQDSHGRITPISLGDVSSWSDLYTLLDKRFCGIRGHKVVQDKRFVLHEAAANRDIEPWRPWEVAFRPGQRIVMCIVIVDYTDWMWSCPRCWVDSPAPLDTEIECPDCGMRYRKESDSYQAESRTSNPTSITTRPFLPRPNPATNSSHRMQFNPDDDAASFKCVRIVSQSRFEPHRSRSRRLQQFNDAVVYMRHSRSETFARNPSSLTRFLSKTRRSYQQAGFKQAQINTLIDELLRPEPRIEVISDITTSTPLSTATVQTLPRSNNRKRKIDPPSESVCAASMRRGVGGSAMAPTLGLREEMHERAARYQSAYRSLLPSDNAKRRKL